MCPQLAQQAAAENGLFHFNVPMHVGTEPLGDKDNLCRDSCVHEARFV